jgi:FkbM family methyltransferase
MTVFDGGAHLGTFALGAALHGAKKIVAVEPDPTSFALLSENLRRNSKIEYYTERCALAENNGRASLSASYPTNAGAARWHITNNPSEATVAATTLAALRIKYGAYDLLKLDIEGSELEALRGDSRWIKQHKPVVWAECNETAESEELLEFFRWAELSPVYLAYPSFRRLNFKNSDERIFPIAYEAVIVGGERQQIRSLDISRLDEEVITRQLQSFSDLREMLWRTPRWGRLAWTGLSKPELIALLGRSEQGLSYNSFLLPPRAGE